MLWLCHSRALGQFGLCQWTCTTVFNSLQQHSASCTSLSVVSCWCTPAEAPQRIILKKTRSLNWRKTEVLFQMFLFDKYRSTIMTCKSLRCQIWNFVLVPFKRLFTVLSKLCFKRRLSKLCHIHLKHQVSIVSVIWMFQSFHPFIICLYLSW